MVGAANPTFFRSPLIQRGTKKTWIWQGEKIAGGLDESGAQKQRTRSCLKTCYQQRRETYAGRCVTNRGERRGDCSEIYLHSLPFGALIILGTAQANRRTDRNTDGQRGGRTNGSSSSRPRKLNSEGLMDGLDGGEADGRRRRKQAARPTTGEQAHRQKHGRTERWTDKRKRK